MTKTVLELYSRYHSLTDGIDQKEGTLQHWQTARLNELADEAETVLAGCRRAGTVMDRRRK